jgi:hypothetical protein
MYQPRSKFVVLSEFATPDVQASLIAIVFFRPAPIAALVPATVGTEVPPV